MVRFFTYVRNHYRIILAVTLFIASSFLIVYLLPMEGKFRYEYHKGTYWKHEDLLAPFNFPVYKTKEELVHEQDSILRDFKPYFIYNFELTEKRLEEFSRDFETGWKEYAVKQLETTEEQYLINRKFRENREASEQYRQMISQWLNEVYLAGIIDLAPLEKPGRFEFTEIMLIKGNLAEVKEVAEMYSPKTAFELVNNRLTEYIEKQKHPRADQITGFFKEFNINYYIAVNVTYDEEKSQLLKDQLLRAISRTRGMIEEGQGIISKGEFITNDKYIILESLRTEYEKNIGTVAGQLVNIGKLVIVLASLLLIFLFLWNFRREMLYDTRDTLFVLLMVVLMIFAAGITLKYDLISIYIMPFAIVPIILRTFFDARLALFVHVVTVILVGFFVPNSYLFVFLNVFAGMVAIFSLTNLYRRSKFIVTAFMVVFSYALIYMGTAIVQEGNFNTIEWKYFAWFAYNGILLLISYPLIYIFERLFGFLSDTTLMELSDTNQPLLRKLAEIAPGTFQHSLQVANLAEEAVHKIGGNPLLVRTGALYHDIGKMDKPFYFIENQSAGNNPHDNIPFEQSALIIIGHVAKGVEIARKNSLPETIIDFIRTHHGTSTVQYFYKSFLKKYPEKDVDVSNFSYPGPKPFTREMAIVMMADSVEAASRSLQQINDKTLDKMVEGIIHAQMEEEQFNDANITFRDITAIKEVFRERLKNINHARITYPE
ncbi:MAG: HDIG domain-containing protein [Bacteroidales bacterium]|nr:HDIG domain-containing protein [Bacteroidales bacterium]MBN2764172.1 HDIG domain-containing protein [Bacteroidales bacterium]